jgi:regulator of sigma E protease
MEVFLIRTLQFILAITILVALHEGGHFFFAKLFGVRVNKFYIFFDYKFSIFSTKFNWWRKLRGKVDQNGNVIPAKKNEDGSYEYEGTEYGMGWIPLGGYCQIEGMIDETQHDTQKLSQPAKDYEFRAKPAWQRLLIMIGGVLVNFLLALFIYCAVFYTWGEEYYAVRDMPYGMKFNQDAKALGFKDGDKLVATDKGEFRAFDANMIRDISKAVKVTVIRYGEEKTISLPGNLSLLDMLKKDPVFCRPYVPAEIDTVMPGSPAEKAGLKKGYFITGLGSAQVDSWNVFTYEAGKLHDALSDCTTRKDSLDVLTTTITYEDKKAHETKTVPVVLDNEAHLGVGMTTIGKYMKPTHVSYNLLTCVPAGIGYAMDMLGGYVSDLKYVFSSEGAKQLGGFGTIGSLFPPVWDWYMFWMMTAFLSIILAFMNILPIPALDGGHVLFLLYEMIFRRKPSDKFMVKAEYFGIAILFALMFVANLNDILRWLGIMY